MVNVMLVCGHVQVFGDEEDHLLTRFLRSEASFTLQPDKINFCG